ncbi:hypothetical protein LVJ94_07000 [Pendulispora rubella]|uniref:Uncharacterized protein n=1 Tax=Pendulispora rubella TaxID=2741070 RepID=A0ABZ2LM57_9BACT
MHSPEEASRRWADEGYRGTCDFRHEYLMANHAAVTTARQLTPTSSAEASAPAPLRMAYAHAADANTGVTIVGSSHAAFGVIMGP